MFKLKRCISFLLCVLLAFSALPVMAVGADEEEPLDPAAHADLTSVEELLEPAEKEALLNAATLHPMITNYEPLDTLVGQIFDETITDDMTTYEKTCALFAYMMRDTYYIAGNQTADETYLTIWQEHYNSLFDRNVVCDAYGMLVEKTGVCNNFAAAFMVLARRLGLDAFVISCNCFSSKIGMGDHYTTAIRLNGRLYLFDSVIGAEVNRRDEVETSVYFCNPMHLDASREYCDFDEQLLCFGGFETGTTTFRPVQEDFPAATLDEIHFSFGSYPQTQVKDENLIAALNGLLDPNGMTSYGYYQGTGEAGSAQQSDYMRYADVTYGGEKYRAVTFSSYRPIFASYPSEAKYSLQDNMGFEPNTVYWFRFDPIEWRLLDEENLLVADLALDAQAFNPVRYEGEGTEIAGKLYTVFADQAHTQPVNNWATSDIRSWLNTDFFNTAFTAAEQALIEETTLLNNGAQDRFAYESTTDRVFLLSRNDIRQSGYAIAENSQTLRTTETDYARIQGISVGSKSGEATVSWLQRSPGFHSGDVCYTTNLGFSHYHLRTDCTMAGIRPALRIDDLSMLIPAALSAPRAVSVKAVDTGVITAKTAVCNGADCYVFEMVPQSPVAGQTVTIVSSSLQVVFEDLQPGMEYVCTVYACRRDETGAITERTAGTASPAELCRAFVHAPTALGAYSVRTGTVTVSWNADSEPDAALFRVYRYVDSDTLDLVGESQGSFCEIPDLYVGARYYFKVTSVSADGYESGFSAETADCVCESVPGKPIGLTAQATATGVITLSWQAPEAAAAAPRYRVFRSMQGEYIECGVTEDTSFVVSGLYVGTEFYFKVYAESPDGDDVSVPAYAKAVSESIPAKPLAPVAVPTATGELTVTWDPVPGAEGYHIYRFTRVDGEPQMIRLNESGILGTSFTDTGLSVGSSRAYYVTAFAGDDESAFSDPSQTVIVKSIPEKPVNVAAYASSTKAVTVTWEPGDNDSAYYKVWRYTSGTARTCVCEYTTDTSYTMTGLSAGTAYYYCVTAYTADGAHESAVSATASATAEIIPLPPTGVQAETTGGGEMTLAWDAVNGAQRYYVLYKTSNDADFTETGPYPVNTAVLNGLTPGVRYYFRVIAETTTAQGVVSQSTPTLFNEVCEYYPPKPERVAAVADGTGRITVSWAADPKAAVYRVYRLKSGVYEVLGDTTALSWTESGLSVGSTYYFRVTALTADLAFESPYAATSALCESYPAVPSGLAGVTTAPGRITVTWDPVPDAAEYLVYRYVGSERTLIGTVQTNEFTAIGLSQLGSYTFFVRAVAADGSESALSAGLQIQCEKIMMTPEQMGAPVAAPSGDGEVTVSWDPCYGATLYYVYRRPVGSSSFTYLGYTTAFSYTDTGLTAGTEYEYRVKPLCSCTGETSISGEYSPTVSVVALGTPGVPEGLSAAPSGDGAITATWEAVAGATRYVVTFYAADDPNAPTSVEVFDTSYTAAGLADGASYWFSVHAVTLTDQMELEGAETWPVSAEAICKPAAPSGLAASASGDGEIRVTWNEVPGADQYTVYRLRGDLNANVPVGTSTGASYTVEGLSGGTTYYFRVTASKSAGTFALESARSAYVSCKAVVKPAVPQNVTASATAENTITVRWSLVKNATQYNVYHRVGDAASFTYYKTVFASAQTPDAYVDTGLTADTAYAYKVVAVTKEAGLTLTSAQSAAASAVAIATPAALQDLTAAPTGDGEISLSWSPVPGAAEYEVFRLFGSKTWTSIGVSETNAWTAEGLTPNTTYYFKVKAISRSGDLSFAGPLSAAAIQKALGTPAVPKNVTAAATDDGVITLSWSAVTGATQYNVYRYRGDKKAYVYIGTSKTNTYKATGLTGGTTYYFKVLAATKEAGLTFVGALSDAAIQKAIGTPAAVKNVTATPTAENTVTVRWSLVNNATQYNIYRSVGANGTFSYYRTVFSDSQTPDAYVDAGLQTGTQYA